MRAFRHNIIGIIIAVLLPAVVRGQGIDITTHYNTALTAYESGDMAEAIYHMEMAHLAAPHSEAISNNLSIMKTDVAVDIVEIEPFFLQRWYDGSAALLSPGGWKYLSLALVAIIVILLYRRYVAQIASTLTRSGTIGGLVLLLLISIVLGLRRQSLLTSGIYGIVMDSTPQLKEGPDQVSDDVKEVAPGVKLQILDTYDQWYKVATLDREQGWIPQSAVQRIMVAE